MGETLAYSFRDANGHEHVDDNAMLMRRYPAAAALLGAIREQVATLDASVKILR